VDPTPNVSRIIRGWGLQQELERIAVKPRAAAWRRYTDGELIGALDTRSIEEEYGEAHYNVHRGELHRMIYNAVIRVTEVKTNSYVASVKSEDHSDCEGTRVRPSIILSDGREIFADLVVGADGVKFVTRKSICSDAFVRSTMNSAYRAILSTEDMLRDPELKDLVEEAHVTCWMGPGRNISGYCISGGRSYNLVFSCPASPYDQESNSWSVPAEVDEIRHEYRGWEPRIQKMINLIPSTSKGKLVEQPVLGDWVHPGGIVLIGDACHPLLPYGGQGAAMAIEDATVLALLLSKMPLTLALTAYTELRKPLCTRIGAMSRSNGAMFHLADGPAQVERDLRLSK
ncbi:hypothetical protein C8R46DRAFT_1308115, partial [Mycena filopes]